MSLFGTSMNSSLVALVARLLRGPRKDLANWPLLGGFVWKFLY